MMSHIRCYFSYAQIAAAVSGRVPEVEASRTTIIIIITIIITITITISYCSFYCYYYYYYYYYYFYYCYPSVHIRGFRAGCLRRHWRRRLHPGAHAAHGGDLLYDIILHYIIL